ncbi:hypothetical protein ACH5RR_016480 [Cinchona calisaya]|uniref:Uncharacterized protein n=1 Tax=Cinchona calisaya TaxID=153742 RepID=A0ABD2ZY52_9GENT
MVGWWKNKREVRLLVHLLLPLFVHWMAKEMNRSVLVDVTTNSLCPGHHTCPEAINLNALQHTTVGIFKVVVAPVLVLLAISKSRGFVYTYYVVHIISLIFEGSIFCITAAYVADVVDDNKKAAGFSWMMGLFSASHVLGNAVARFLPGAYIFEVSIALFIFCPVYMTLFLAETVTPGPKVDQCLPYSKKAFKIVQEQYKSMIYAANVVISSPTLRCISLALFFYELGISGVTSTLLHHPLVGEKVILCAALLSSAVYALLYGLAWAIWVPYFAASFEIVNVLVKPASFALISRASSSTDPGKAQGFILGVESIALLLSTLGMTALTNLFLSRNAPFNCKGFGFICASFSVAISLCFAWTLKPNLSNKNLKVDAENVEAPLLS